MVDGLLADVLNRLQVAPAGAVELSGAELERCAADSAGALRAAGLLVPGRPADGIVCPGCEQACAMPVEQVPRAGREPLLFIVCDKRDDMASVPVPGAALERWRLTDAGLADVLSRLLAGGAATLTASSEPKYRLGIVAGRQRKDVAYLARQRDALVLLLAGHALDLLTVLRLQDGRVTLDDKLLQRTVDAPAGIGEPVEQPEERRQRLLALVAAEKKRNPQKFLQAAADKEGISVFALKQVIYRKPKALPADTMADMARTLASPIPQTPKPKR
ncbi:MAG: hypothetical protein JNL87_17730 [Burkholderiaceae bacterium]|nr:hypothetical protein [Burkholderiaceae bacterium]